MSAFIVKIVFAILSTLLIISGSYATKRNFSKKPIVFIVALVFLAANCYIFLSEFSRIVHIFSPEIANRDGIYRDECSNSFPGGERPKKEDSLVIKISKRTKKVHIYISGRHKYTWRMRHTNLPNGRYIFTRLDPKLIYVRNNMRDIIHCVMHISDNFYIYGKEFNRVLSEPIVGGVELHRSNASVIYSVSRIVGQEKVLIIVN